MPKAGGQDREAGAGLARPAVVQEGLVGEAVPQIVAPGAACHPERDDAMTGIQA